MREKLKTLRATAICAANKVFGRTPYALEVSLTYGKPTIRVSYRDFKTEDMVERELRFLMGDDYDYRIFRSYSENVIKDFLFDLYRHTNKYGHGFHAQVEAAICDKVFV